MIVPEQFNQFTQLPDAQSKLQFAAQHPGLLKKEFILEVKDILDHEYPDADDQYMESLATLDYIRATASRDSSFLPIGLGPIEGVFVQVNQGEISFDIAIEKVKSPDIVNNLSNVYVQTLTHKALDSMTTNNWRNAAKLIWLLVESVNASPDIEENKYLRFIVWEDWLQIAKLYISRVPDGRVFKLALDCGEKMLELWPADKIGDANYLIGTLYLDPYVVNHNHVDYEASIHNWKKHLSDELGSMQAAIVDENYPMPTPEEAITHAVDHLKIAVQLRAGHTKGTALKALIQAKYYLIKALGKDVDLVELTNLANEAVLSIDPQVNPEPLVYVQNIAELLDLNITNKQINTENIQFDERLPHSEVTKIMDEARVLLRQEPERALHLLLVQKALIEADATEEIKTIRFKLLLDIVENIYADSLSLEYEGDSIIHQLDNIKELAKEEHWPDKKLAATIFCLSYSSPEGDRELEGLEVIAEARKLDSNFMPDDDLFVFQESSLWQNVAVNFLNAGDDINCILSYGKSLAGFHQLNFRFQVMRLLDKIRDIATHNHPDIPRAITYVFQDIATTIGVHGDEALEFIHEIFVNTARSITDDILQEDFLAFRLLAKGHAFRHILAAKLTLNIEDDISDKYLMTKIAEIEQIVDTPHTSALNENTLLTARIRAKLVSGGENPSQVLANLQHKFDANIMKHLYMHSADMHYTKLSTQLLTKAIPTDTVLLDYYYTPFIIYTCVMTNEEILYIKTKLSEVNTGTFSIGRGPEIDINGVTALVSELREKLMYDPGRKTIQRKAQESVAACEDYFFGTPLQQHLQEQYQFGKRHICIVPHGALHYLPFHLFTSNNEALLEKWKLSYLPNIGLLPELRKAYNPVKRRAESFEGFALKFVEGSEANKFGLEPIPNSHDEVHKISSIFNTQPMLEEQANATNLYEKMNSTRYLHISSHGEHNYNAPAFQTLFLYPSAEHDGRIYAYEFLNSRIDGLEIISLSACETALGRFDYGDNQRGIVASLLQSGAQTIVGTLWPTSSTATEIFFPVFYRAIKARKSRIDAFYEAQTYTRNKLPQVRHWGAFTLIGDWS